MTQRPRYPIYVPSKSRSHVTARLTVRTLLDDGTPFRLVVEPSEADDYAKAFPAAELLVMPRDDMRLLGARNWIRDHAEAEGHARHWQLDDNIRNWARSVRGHRVPCNSSVALRVCEEFTDRYTNIGVSGLNYRGFVSPSTRTPFYVNCHVYSISLINHAMPCRWRLVYNDDTDLCLQALAAGWCTVALNVFMADKVPTMIVSGGNTDQLYRGDGRLRMARSLERQWPHVVSVDRRWDRPQHVVRGAWRGFDTKLIRRDDLDWSAFPETDELGVEIVRRDVIRSSSVVEILDHFSAGVVDRSGAGNTAPHDTHTSNTHPDRPQGGR